MWWKTKKGEKAAEGASLLRLLTALNNRLRAWAALLQQKTARFSPRRLRWTLALFCLLSVAACTYIIAASLRQRQRPFSLAPIQLVQPAHVRKETPFVSQEDFTRLSRLKHSLDSLASSADGKRRLDSILLMHPGLLDTIASLQNIYHAQNKN